MEVYLCGATGEDASRSTELTDNFRLGLLLVS